ncbi:MAG: sulfurtransferase [Microcoleus sp. PH2017_10_PVI_O_A]|uniref:sulfurtransferase n=1 Tax=unclassified Microcoleus TaxID=2642155 RepID=UPI001D458A10|nr:MULTISPECIES: rhodanese-like domain-containing protein [unclassified Microcoleus]TAE81655.1 MAG: sulfurtransferase [Oscillatoriales cyanobacterium]MCC3407121.1 sulfurtransferase [Microcoleus sp. PH2017_10_PVI_O_A]MCC3461131.1 sulfurtransferase [Microcoleus sp. PH2017_11_PCY_U_A]MCC3479647.1 sulfurtransferase [Microcoleus sp. PH2017_12_PCY_D_A]MCC3531858.1 sulfurtransferase [Microcoleus sp. PH2017_21_RUC_O_A]
MSNLLCNLADNWIVSADLAKELLSGGATLLDARAPILKWFCRLPPAIPVTWQQFSRSHFPHKGQIIEDDTILTEKLQALGICQDQPVIVIADSVKGWGEDGRIVWMLRTLGHEKAVFVDGGYRALVKAGISQVKCANHPPPPGDFVVSSRSTWEIQQDDLKAILGNPNLAIIDARESREYAGKTPYGEKRGGHIPGAIHLYYKQLMDKQGQLLAREEIVEFLQQKGVSLSAQIVTYCSGGIRSAWLTSVLTSLGFDAKNYAGSMWEWSASPADSYPLEKSRRVRQ